MTIPTFEKLKIWKVKTKFCRSSGSLCDMLLANSLEYPERIQRGLEWTQFLKRVFFVLCLLVGKFSHFPSFNLLFLYSTVQKSVVQYRYLFGASILQRSLMYCNVKYKAAGPVRAVISIRYGSKEGVQGSLLVP